MPSLGRRNSGKIEVTNLKKYFPIKRVSDKAGSWVKAVDDVSFDLKRVTRYCRRIRLQNNTWSDAEAIPYIRQ